MNQQKKMMLSFILQASLSFLSAQFSFASHFLEEERDNAIEISLGSFVAPSEQTTTDFIREEHLDLLAQGREAGGRVKPRLGLSIDGGGIRGVMPALWLRTLKTTYEDEGEEGIEAPLHEIFDYVGGTSIGGIISLGIAAGLEPEAIVTIFENDNKRKKIFSSEGRRLARFVDFFGLFGYRYASNHLESLMQETFGEQRLSDLKTNILVTACTVEGHPWIFKKEGEVNYKLWEVARSTSAAPTYFPSYKIQFPIQATRPEFVDGGLWINNPSTLITASIVKELQGSKFTPNKLHILSLGTGDAHGQAIPRSAGLLSAGALIEALMNSHNRGNHMLMHQLLGENYHRINAEMSEMIDLADTSDQAYTALKDYAEQEEHQEKMKAFVDQTKSLIRHKLEDSSGSVY